MEEVYKEYSRIVYCYLISLGANSDIAEELMQETFYSAIKNIGKFRNECSIKTWLCQIAKNKWINYMRKFKNENNVAFDENTINTLDEELLEDKIILKEEVAEIEDKIITLDKRTQCVIQLRIRAGLGFKEIGKLFGKNENWARVVFYRGKVKVMEVVENEQRS